MKIISWNVNGLMSTIENDCFKRVADLNLDFLCLQEIRTEKETTVLKGFRHFWHHAKQAKYSGTVTISRYKPLAVDKGFADTEGRLITLEFEKFYLINVYVPNSQLNLKRREYRLKWDDDFLLYISETEKEKPLIISGDFNVTRSSFDVFAENERMQSKEVGFMTDERANLEKFLQNGFVDVFRELHPTTRCYTWWSNRLNQRKINHGWRLDFFIISEELLPRVTAIQHLTDIEGSDHCPIILAFNL